LRPYPINFEETDHATGFSKFGNGRLDDRRNAGCQWHNIHYIEVVSKPQIAFESKAQADEKAQHTLKVCEHFKEVCNAAIGRYMGF
jgi:hypothetical protein